MGQSGAALPQRVQLADWQCSILTFRIVMLRSNMSEVMLTARTCRCRRR